MKLRLLGDTAPEYPPEVHALYRDAVASLLGRLCRGEVEMDAPGPIVPMTCRAGCEDHTLEINERTLRRLVTNVNAEAHELVKIDFAHLPEAERRELHAGMLELSQSYFDFFDEVRAQKVSAHKQHQRENRRRQRRTNNRAIELDLEATKVSTEHLFEFIACYRKHRHPSQEAATTALADGLHGSDEGYQVYACEYCGGWHVGHPVGPTAPRYYRITRAQMIWSTQRKLANQFASERQLITGDH